MQPDRAGHFLRRGLLAVLLCVACTVSVMAAPVHLPAIVEPPSQEHHIGRLIFVRLVTPDIAAAASEERLYVRPFTRVGKDHQN